MGTCLSIFTKIDKKDDQMNNNQNHRTSRSQARISVKQSRMPKTKIDLDSSGLRELRAEFDTSSNEEDEINSIGHYDRLSDGNSGTYSNYQFYNRGDYGYDPKPFYSHNHHNNHRHHHHQSNQQRQHHQRQHKSHHQPNFDYNQVNPNQINFTEIAGQAAFGFGQGVASHLMDRHGHKIRNKNKFRDFEDEEFEDDDDEEQHHVGFDSDLNEWQEFDGSQRPAEINHSKKPDKRPKKTEKPEKLKKDPKMRNSLSGSPKDKNKSGNQKAALTNHDNSQKVRMRTSQTSKPPQRVSKTNSPRITSKNTNLPPPPPDISGLDRNRKQMTNSNQTRRSQSKNMNNKTPPPPPDIRGLDRKPLNASQKRRSIVKASGGQRTSVKRSSKFSPKRAAPEIPNSKNINWFWLIKF